MVDAVQYATLRAVVDRMIPRDDVPGGLDAGVDRYLIHFLQHDGCGYAPAYIAFLDAINHHAQQQHQCTFDGLSAAAADGLLQYMTDEPSIVIASLRGAQIIALIAEHCAEGFYADPRQGGNIDMVSWRMIGFEERR
ncbi:MAG: gluconate 2-dehydrogenase subunit 3 family protein [Roseiflexaceae bacterium]